jgi:hypothetical protein
MFGNEGLAEATGAAGDEEAGAGLNGMDDGRLN